MSLCWVSFFQTGAIPGNTWQYFYDNWQYLAIPENTLTILTNAKQYLPFQTILTNTKQYLPIRKNTKQYQTNLVLDGITKASRIVTNTIPVLSWYNQDLFLTVFCLSGIITVPILVIFTKPSMPNMFYNFYLVKNYNIVHISAN